MSADASFDQALIGPIRDRWSPRSFSDRQLTALDLRQLFEAARWAASCFNEQPWRFIVTRRGEPGHAAMLGCLVERNQRWAKAASALVITAVCDTFTGNGKPNRWAQHDLGLAVGQLSLQAASMGISLHQMAGFDADAARERLGIPEGVTPMTAIALGYLGSVRDLDDSLRDSESRERERLPQADIVFDSRFGQPLAVVEPWAEVLSFWFGDLDEHGLSSEETSKRWFTKSDTFDAEVRERFATLHAEFAAGGHRDWMRSARGAIAAVVALDQFSRNMYRDAAEMYATDELAAELTLRAIELGFDRALPAQMRSFFYMPLMHSESVERQQLCVDLFTRFAAQLSGPAHDKIAPTVGYAVMHRDIVVRFGRFPHRNAILGRESTPLEAEFLDGPGSSF